MSVPSRPLAGIRVVDITANVAGPLACQVLRDLGADVVKVEPLTGDAARRITATAPGSEHVTPYFSPHNRGKKSVQLDLGAERGKNALRRLLSEADVLVQGMRPGTLERQGFGAAAVAGINPRCIYVSLSAYGSGSPLEDRPGIDMMVQAESGMLSAQPDGELPRLIPFQLVDGATGHVLAQSVLAALLHRERAGVVNAVEVALYDVACSLQANYLTLHMNTPTLASGKLPASRRGRTLGCLRHRRRPHRTRGVRSGALGALRGGARGSGPRFRSALCRPGPAFPPCRRPASRDRSDPCRPQHRRVGRRVPGGRPHGGAHLLMARGGRVRPVRPPWSARGRRAVRQARCRGADTRSSLLGWTRAGDPHPIPR